MRRRTAFVVLSLLLLTSNARAQADDDAKALAAEDEKLLQSRQIAVDGPGLLEYFRSQTLGPVDERRVRELLRHLGNSTFRFREKAAAELTALGPKVVPLLRKAAEAGDLESRRRAEKCMQIIASHSTGDLLAAAARLVQIRCPAGAWAVLLEYLPSARDPEVEEAVVDALWQVVRQDGRIDPALAAALEDEAPSRRAAAALVLGRLGDTAQRTRVRKLLADPNPIVRLRTGQGLLAAGDKRAVPALMDLLETAPLEVAQRAEDILNDLAGGQAHQVCLEERLAARRKCHDAWQEWWQTHRNRLDLTRRKDGLAPANPTTQVRAVGQRFIEAVARKDVPALLRTVDLPFSVLGEEVFKTREEFENKLGKEVTHETGLTLRIVKVGRAHHLFKSAGDKLRAFLKDLPLSELHIVYLQVREKGEKTEDVSLIVRVRGSRARVIGIGESRPEQGNP
jgi:hypothetical protein